MALVTEENLNSTFVSSYQAYNRRTGVMSSVVTTGNPTSLKRLRQEDSVKTPGFKKLKASQLPINPYYYHVEIVSDPRTTWQADVDTYPVTPTSAMTTYYYVGNCQSKGVSIQALGSADDPDQRAIAKLLGKISEGKTNTSVTLGEFTKTAELVAYTATRLYKSIRALKRGEFGTFAKELGVTYTMRDVRRFNKRFNKAKSFDAQENYYSSRTYRGRKSASRVTDFAADTWLQYKYGWMPLLNDVENHAKALAEIMIERSNVIRWVSAGAKCEKRFKSVDKNADGTLCTYTRTTYDRRLCKYGVGYRIQGGGFTSYDALGIGNPLEVAWELLPFSFVADWFVPVGEFLRSLTATQGLEFVKGYKSIRNMSQVDFSFIGNGTTVVNGGTRYGPLYGHGDGSRFVMDQVRTKLTSFPALGIPDFRDPRGTKDGGLSRAASAIALLQSLFLRGK